MALGVRAAFESQGRVLVCSSFVIVVCAYVWRGGGEGSHVCRPPKHTWCGFAVCGCLVCLGVRPAIINNAIEGQPLSVSISGTHDLWWSQLKKGHGGTAAPPPFWLPEEGKHSKCNNDDDELNINPPTPCQ